MISLLISLFVCSAWSGLAPTAASDISRSLQTANCRNVPGNPGFPTNEQWAALNSTVSGRLVKVVPFVEFCSSQGGCTPEQFTSASFRAGVPGAMDEVNLFFFWVVQSKLIHDFFLFFFLQPNWEQVWTWPLVVRVGSAIYTFSRTSFQSHHLFVNRNLQ